MSDIPMVALYYLAEQNVFLFLFGISGISGIVGTCRSNVATWRNKGCEE